MNAAVKLLTAHYPVMQIVGRSFNRWHRDCHADRLPAALRQAIAGDAPARDPARPLLRCWSATWLCCRWRSAVPLAAASAIGFTSPLLVTAMSVPLLGEQVGWRRWSAVVVGFAGALLIIRPGTGLANPAVLLLLVSVGLLCALSDRDPLGCGVRSCRNWDRVFRITRLTGYDCDPAVCLCLAEIIRLRSVDFRQPWPVPRRR